MKREDLLLRDAARNGDARACLQMARRLFSGEDGFARNYKLGLAYLQQQLADGVRAAVLLVAGSVPLEVLMAQRARALLVDAAAWGCEAAQAKLLVWQQLLAAAHPPGLARMLGEGAQRGLLDPAQVLLAGAREALQAGQAAAAAACLRAAVTHLPARGRVAELVCELVRLVRREGGSDLGLPREVVEASLADRSEHGDTEARFLHGCALAGIDVGSLAAGQLAARPNLRRAVAQLLRAADAGEAQAWLRLYDITSSERGVAGNQEAARFFLEKAAHAGAGSAQRTLGKLLLSEADSLARAELGVHWLSAAAQGGDETARELLRTLVLPLPALPQAVESSIVEKVRALDAELAARLALARTFHLTRREALNFDARRDLRPWGVLIPGTASENPKGRLAPAVDEPMMAELRRLATVFQANTAPAGQLTAHKARTQRHVFKALSIPEDLFFPREIGRSRTHYGFGRHWARRAESLLGSLDTMRS